MIYFSSDHHFDHKNIISYTDRPFSGVNEMNEIMVQRWNTVVTDNDEIYCLGDFSLDFRAVKIFTPQLKGKKYLVPGNHDDCHPRRKKSAKMLQKYKDLGWTVLPVQTDLIVPNLVPYPGWLLCHFPYKHGDFELQRYRELRPDPENRLLLHGHCHSTPKTFKKDNMIDVGVDAHDFYPVSLNQILEIVS